MGRLGVGLVALSCLVTASPAVAECLPTAVSVGDPAIVQSVGERLAASGIAITASVGCPAVQVRIERRGEQLVLEMTDSFSRRGRREVRDVATAAAIIESWTLQAHGIRTRPETPRVLRLIMATSLQRSRPSICPDASAASS